MDKKIKQMILDDFAKERAELETIAVNTKWAAKTIVLPFLTSLGVPVSVRYGYKESKFLEINVISDNNVLEYIKLNE